MAEQNGGPAASPFVGLRPFRSDEALLFFGRRHQTAELLDRLHEAHFLAVVGSSGCGKSSLIRAGLIPALQGGFLVGDRDQWVDIIMTPGKNPLDRLAREFKVAMTDMREGGAPFLVEKLQGQRESSEKNCFLLVDQFEELFRFSRSAGNQEDAADFVSILLALAEQRQFPVFVTLTMRSDFLDDCDAFYGLPEAFNHGQYLVPRLSREQRQEAIEGPVILFRQPIIPSIKDRRIEDVRNELPEHLITSRLVDRVLNDVGDEPDQLPVMEHALMRTWEKWQAGGATGPLDVEHYEAAGTAKEALSIDADSAMAGMSQDEQALTATIFKALTDTDSSNRKIRRPAQLSDLAEVSGRPVSEILSIIERFRTGGRSFLNLQNEPSGDALIDISHESLIRQWNKLRAWVDEEAEKKRIYLDLVDAVKRRKALLHHADLQVALDWRKNTRPTKFWARRYSPLFAEVMKYLDESLAEKEREDAEKAHADAEKERAAALAAAEKERADAERLRRTRQTVAIVSVLLVLAIGAAGFAFYQWREANREKQNAETQAGIARRASQLVQDTNTQLTGANDKLKREKKRADDNATQSLVNASEARKQAQKAQDNEKKARDSEKEAKDNAADAIHQRTIAQDNATEANRQRTIAQNNELDAKKQSHAADEARDAADKATAQAKQLLVQALVQYAGHLVNDKRNPEALAFLSRAIQEDKTSRNGKDSILNLLLHEVLPKANSGPKGEPFIHQPWDLHSPLQSVTYSPGPRSLIALGSNAAAQYWDPAAGPQSAKTVQKGAINSVAFSQDGRLVTASADKTARVWNLATGRQENSLPVNAPVISAAFSPDGRQVLTAALEKNNSVKVWNLSNNSDAAIRFPLTAPAEFAAFCPDPNQKLVVTVSWNTEAQIWDGSGSLLQRVGTPGKVRSAQFSPKCNLLVTASTDNTAQVWDWKARQFVGDALKHDKAVNSAVFSPDPNGSRVLTASDDGTARIWDTGSGTPLGAPLVHDGPVRSAAFSPDGSKVVTASNDGKSGRVRVWEVEFPFDDTDLLAKLAQAVSGYDTAGLPDKVVQLSDQNRAKLWNTIRNAATQINPNAGETARFVRWYLSLSN